MSFVVVPVGDREPPTKVTVNGYWKGTQAHRVPQLATPAFRTDPTNSLGPSQARFSITMTSLLFFTL